MAQDIWAIVNEVNLDLGKTSKGDPKRGTKTDKNGWVQLTGDRSMLETIVIGAKVRYTEPKEFGPKKTKFATLYEIEFPKPAEQPKPQAAAPAPAPTNGKPAEIKPPAYVPPAIPAWNEYAAMMRAAHHLAKELEPDSEMDAISRAQARAALVNTAMIAFSNGKISAPVEGDEIPGSDAPLPTDDGCPF